CIAINSKEFTSKLQGREERILHSETKAASTQGKVALRQDLSSGCRNLLKTVKPLSKPGVFWRD
ncbi:MAG: hypothetical protein M1553_05270, partial [Firmicutes bacterium]|nr:hypothetical protein [Bacillota bacterium]